MPGRFEGLNDLEWKLFQDIFPKTEKKRSLRYASHTIPLRFKYSVIHINYWV